MAYGAGPITTDHLFPCPTPVACLVGAILIAPTPPSPISSLPPAHPPSAPHPGCAPRTPNPSPFSFLDPALGQLRCFGLSPLVPMGLLANRCGLLNGTLLQAGVRIGAQAVRISGLTPPPPCSPRHTAPALHSGSANAPNTSATGTWLGALPPTRPLWSCCPAGTCVHLAANPGPP